MVGDLFLVKGLVIGFSIAAPVGPIGVLCIMRSLAGGRMQGFISGLGAATADAVYGCIAGFGLTAVANFLIAQQMTFKIIGGLFLCYMGLSTFLSKPALQEVRIQEDNLLGAYLSVFFLTLTNPMTILSFVAIFAGLGLATTSNYLSAMMLVVGVFLGSALWWFVLSSLANGFKEKLNSNGLQWVNRFSALVLLGFGIVTLSN